MPKPHLDAVAVSFRPGRTLSTRRKVAADCHLDGHSHRANLPGERFAVIAVKHGGEGRAARHRRALTALAAHRDVVRAAPIHRHGGLQVLATDRVWIGIKPGQRLPSLPRGARVLERTPEGDYLIRLPAGVDPARLVRRLRVGRRVDYAEPDHVLIGSRQLSSAEVQQALEVTRTPEAWQAQVGSSAVVIGVVDCGVLGSHPDLRACLTTGFDATGRRRSTDPDPWDAHGTQCAGLAAGAGVGPSGVRGVAAGCLIMPIRVGFTPTRDAGYLSKYSWIRRGIDWAWRHGVSVLNMSFGGGPPSKAVTRALRRAHQLGRDGRGVVLVAAAGNSAGPGAPVEYPAVMPEVIAVGATDEQDTAQSVASGSIPWVSNAGPAVDIAAPGVNDTTTTVPDPTFSEPSFYTNLFSGTSAAAPLVAGAAALIISAVPTLAADGVRAALLQSADKVGKVPYRNGRNDHMGCGRLNVAAALAAATGPAMLAHPVGAARRPKQHPRKASRRQGRRRDS